MLTLKRRIIEPFQGKEPRVKYFDISPDGEYVVIRHSISQENPEDKTIFVYKNTGELVSSFRECNNIEAGVAFWGDWSKILVPGCDEIMYDPQNPERKRDRDGLKCYTLGERDFDLPFEYAPVNGILGHLFGTSPDGRYIIACGHNRPACLIDHLKGTFLELSYDFGGISRGSAPLIFDLRSKYIIERRGGLNLGFRSGMLDLETGKWHPRWIGDNNYSMLTQDKPLLLNFHPIESAVLTSQSEYAENLESKKLEKFHQINKLDFEGNQLEESLPVKFETISAAYSADGEIVLCGAKTGEIYAIRGNTVSTAKIAHTGPVLKIQFSRNENTAISISNQEILVWEV